MSWQTVIGLEIHVQLDTRTKIFSGASTAYGAAANTQACAIDLGLPGVLPTLNRHAVELAVKFGLAVGGAINQTCRFARKNYFYPDLPKGYQISQDRLPIVSSGHLDIVLEDNSVKRIELVRAHLEEDAGKSVHDIYDDHSGIDLNRASVPLLEIVSEPQMANATEAVAYLKAMHTLVRHLGISDGNMQEGSFRCDANISIRKSDSDPLGTRCEIKNLNSFRFVEKAINYEVERHIDILESGGTITQETRLYDSAKNETRSLRSKENVHDYRYFPDPDLPPVVLQDSTIEAIRASLPEMPWEKRERFVQDYQLSAYDAALLTAEQDRADYYEAVAAATSAKLAANWVAGELLGALNKANLSLSDCPISAEQLSGLLKRIEDNTISGKIAKTVFEAMWHRPEHDADSIIAEQGLQQITDSSAIEALIDQAIANSPQQLEQYRNGKDKLFGYFVGQVMKASQGKANPEQVNQLLKSKLGR